MPKKSWLLLFAELTMNALMQSSQTVSCKGILALRANDHETSESEEFSLGA